MTKHVDQYQPDSQNLKTYLLLTHNTSGADIEIVPDKKWLLFEGAMSICVIEDISLEAAEMQAVKFLAKNGFPKKWIEEELDLTVLELASSCSDLEKYSIGAKVSQYYGD